MGKVVQYPKRIQFAPGKQRLFVTEALSKLDITEEELGKLLGVHRRTINSWKREQCLMSLPGLEYLCKKLNRPFPEDVEIQDPFWYVNLGAAKGWQTNLLKYGGILVNEEYRKKKWYQWYKSRGQYASNRKIGITSPVSQPRYSKDLAEFVGIMLGDGGMTTRQLKVSLNSVTDKEYADFVRDLIERLFNVPVVFVTKDLSKCVDLRVSRVRLVEYCNQKISLHIGDKLKQGLDIPDWVKKRPIYKRRCLRGLVDTDGGVYHERHTIKGKVYSYPRLCFTSASVQLIESVMSIFRENGFYPKMRRRGRAVQLENAQEIRQYFDVIGSSNPKHLKRLRAG